MSDIPKDMPCKRNCPDRQPGCYCSKKKEWDARKEEKKAMIYKQKSAEFAVAQIRNPPRAERLRQKNVR